MTDFEYNRLKMRIEQEKPLLHARCYVTNNRYAYLFDTTGVAESEFKIYNFVPTYDNWCLCCSKKDCTLRCANCKVYYCSAECQKKSWPVHKNHCKRDLFTLCSLCGNSIVNKQHLKCDKCPVKFCNEDCKQKIISTHKDFDCDTFAKMYNL